MKHYVHTGAVHVRRKSVESSVYGGKPPYRQVEHTSQAKPEHPCQPGVDWQGPHVVNSDAGVRGGAHADGDGDGYGAPERN